jgi:Protein of unknown function (DUF5818)
MRISGFVVWAAVAAMYVTTVPAGAQTGGHIGPSNGAIAGGIVGAGAAIVGVVVAVAVVHSHHLLSGCIASGPNGAELRTSDAKTWSLEGAPADIKPGDRVKVHGERVSHRKSSSGAQVFKVDKLIKDYGSCPG